MKLNYKRTVFVGFAFFLICAFWQAYDTIVPLILTNRFHMEQTWSGFILSLDNILAVFLLPFFGTLSDKTKSRFGRRTPYIALGTVVSIAFFALLGFADTLPFFIIMLLGALFAMATFRSPAVALMPDVTVKPLRSKANAVINLMGTLGGSVMLLLAIPFKTSAEGKTDFSAYILATCGVMALSLVAYLLTVKEPLWAADMEKESRHFVDLEEEEREEKKGKLSRGQFVSLVLLLASVALWYIGYNAVTSKYSVYATNFLHVSYSTTLLIANAAALIFFLPVGMLSAKIGRKRSILIGVAILFFSFLGASFIRSTTPPLLMNLLFAAAGIGWATINVNSFPMVVEMATGADVGKYTGYYYTASMAAQVVTPTLSGFLMDYFGKVWQEAYVVDGVTSYVGYETLFPYATVAVGLAFITMLFVRHGDATEKAA